MFDLMREGAPALRRLRDEMDRLFSGALHGVGLDAPGFPTLGSYPALNVWETENSVVAEVEVPGLDLADIDLEVVGSELAIRGERKEKEPKESVYHRRERPFGKFSRSIQLGADIDSGKVEASLRDGVLLITLAKAEAAKPRKISIRGA